MIHVLAIITAHPGMRDRILAAYRDNVAAVRAEDGCVQYEAVVDAAGAAPGMARFGDDSFVVVERWESMAALQAHAVAPHMKAYAQTVRSGRRTARSTSSKPPDGAPRRASGDSKPSSRIPSPRRRRGVRAVLGWPRDFDLRRPAAPRRRCRRRPALARLRGALHPVLAALRDGRQRVGSRQLAALGRRLRSDAEPRPPDSPGRLRAALAEAAAAAAARPVATAAAASVGGARLRRRLAARRLHRVVRPVRKRPRDGDVPAARPLARDVGRVRVWRARLRLRQRAPCAPRATRRDRRRARRGRAGPGRAGEHQRQAQSALSLQHAQLDPDPHAPRIRPRPSRRCFASRE